MSTESTTYSYIERTAKYYCPDINNKNLLVLRLDDIDSDLAYKINLAINKVKEETKNKCAQDIIEEIHFYNDRTLLNYMSRA